MNDPIQAIIAYRDQILIAEIGALLHDIGKCHPEFIKNKSIENIGNFDHCEIDNFLPHDLIVSMKDKRSRVNINNEEIDIYSIVKEHHSTNTKKKLIKLIQSCDRADSADDKGIVRKKQSMKNTVISSPFGYSKGRINLENLEKKRNNLYSHLIDSFRKYISGSVDIVAFRNNIIGDIKTEFTQALGETRIPSNDVTLWDHSHSTASLFKSTLYKMALGEVPEENRLQWRVFGCCWDGTGFVNRSKKIADILERNKILENIKEQLKIEFENEVPVGNAIYEDINGTYFTFPDLENDVLKEVAHKCAGRGLEIIRNHSSSEIFPFFVLSRPSRALTILADVLRFASAKRKIPKMSSTLYVDNDSDEEMIENNPKLTSTGEEQDICPICQFRPKALKSDTCNICRNRRRKRRDEWFSERKRTIWMDEVADANNRVALLVLSFSLDKWLDGTMVQTIYSQTFEDWYSCNERICNNRNYRRRISSGLGVDTEEDSKRNLAKHFMEFFISEVSRDPDFEDNQNNVMMRTSMFNTFFEELTTTIEEKDANGQDNPTYIKRVWENLKSRTGSTDPEGILSYLFTQNPSPARLYRIWKETEDFLEFAIEEMKKGLYCNKWKRLRFNIDISKINLKSNAFIKENTPYIVKIKGLEPESLLIFHSSDGEFYTIESLGKFKFKDKSEIHAVRKALKISVIYYLSEEDNPDMNLLEREQRIIILSGEQEEYYPLIIIAKSPISLQIIIPASDSPEILELITELYNERFANVIGKLPLNMGLLASRRKFPLYVLLDAQERILNDEGFKEPIIMDPYWKITKLRANKYYSLYPFKKSTSRDGYTLGDLKLVSRGRLYALYPGYFDFDLLSSTICRYKINYSNNRRADDDYNDFSGRPYFFYQIPKLVDMWRVLSNISSSQRSFIEEMLRRKIEEWRKVNDSNKNIVFRTFSRAVLKDAFEDIWENFREETQDFAMISSINRLLLDAIDLFMHTVKISEVD